MRHCCGRWGASPGACAGTACGPAECTQAASPWVQHGRHWMRRQRPAADRACNTAGLTITPSEAFLGKRTRVFPFTCRIEEGTDFEVASFGGIPGI